MLNEQPIEKLIKSPGDILDVYNIFGLTFQGEGPFVGMPCVFVRLAGCNLQCPACDTIYTGSPRHHMHIHRIVEAVTALWFATDKNITKRLVVISGGEPFRQNLGPLCRALMDTGYFVQIETNGTLPVNVGVDMLNIDTYQRHGVYIVTSPKTAHVQDSIWKHACAVKYVLNYSDVDETDGLPGHVLGHKKGGRVSRPPISWNRPIYLQPMDHSLEESKQCDIKEIHQRNRASLRATKASCLRYGYNIGIQTHKVIGVD